MACKDAIDNALMFAGMWMGIKDGQEPFVHINTDFNPAFGLDPDLILKAIDMGVISREQAHQEFKRRGLIGDNWDWEDVKAMIEDESRTSGPTGALTGLSSQFPVS